MAPAKVAMVRFSLGLHDLAACSAIAEAAVRCRSAPEARTAVRELADSRLHDLL